MKNVFWINLLVGIWLIIAAFTVGGGIAASHALAANDVVLGILLVAFAWWVLAAIAPPVGTAWFQMICGIWLLFAPFVLRYSSRGGAVANDVICGIIAIVVAAIGSPALTRPRTVA